MLCDSSKTVFFWSLLLVGLALLLLPVPSSSSTTLLFVLFALDSTSVTSSSSPCSSSSPIILIHNSPFCPLRLGLDLSDLFLLTLLLLQSHHPHPQLSFLSSSPWTRPQ